LPGQQELHAQPLGRIVADLDDDGFHQHLLAAGVELADDLAKLALHVGVGGDHDGVGAGIARDHRRPAPRDTRCSRRRSPPVATCGCGWAGPAPVPRLPGSRMKRVRWCPG
jgi:hypothetical protein